jgi:hypothetical protein
VIFGTKSFKLLVHEIPKKGSLFQNLGIGAASELGSRITNSWYVESQKAIDRDFHGMLSPFQHSDISKFKES